MTEKRSLTAQDLYRLRLISDARISPDGGRIAFVRRHIDEKDDDYVSNIYVVDREGTLRQFTSGGKDSGPRWSPDGRYLAFISGRKEEAQVHLMPADGGESFALTDLKHGAGIPFWSPDSQCIAFTGVVALDPETDEEEGDDKKRARTKAVKRASYKIDAVGYVGDVRRHIFVIDVARRAVRQITDGDYNDDDPAWAPDGEQIAFSTSRSERWDVSPEADIYVVPRSGGKPRPVTQGNALARPAFSVDGKRIYAFGTRDPDDVFVPSRLYSVLLDGSDLKDELGDWDGNFGEGVLSDVVAPHDEYGFYVIPRPEGAYFIGSTCGRSNVFQAVNGRVEAVTDGAQTISDFSIADDGTIAYVRSDSTHPSEVFLLQEGGPIELTHENDALLDEVHIAQPELVSFDGALGERSEGWILAPPSSEQGKHPLIVYIHGGPQLAHGEIFFFEYQFLAGQGFGIFYPNIHGSSTYGRAYQVSINGAWGTIDFEDVLAGTRAAIMRPWVDANRVGIAGGSYGGYMSFWALGHTDLFKAGLIERCLCNIVSFFGTSDSGWSWNRSFGTYPEQDVNKLWDMSPLKYAAQVQAPALVMHSEGDDRTPLEQGEQAFVVLRRLGKETEFVVYPEESHGMTRRGKPSRRVNRMNRVLEWFRTYLMPAPASGERGPG